MKLDNTTYITISKSRYDLIIKNYEEIQQKFEEFKNICEKDSKYIIISEEYNVLNELKERLKENFLYGFSKSDYVKTYKSESYEDFLNTIFKNIEKVHGRTLEECKELVENKNKVEINIVKLSKIERILQIIKE